MTKPWRWHPAAEAEAFDAADWYREQREGLDVQFSDAVNAGFVRLKEAPGLSTLERSVPAKLGVRRRRLARFPFALVFVELADEYLVVAVAHVKRRPGYWKGRLAK